MSVFWVSESSPIGLGEQRQRRDDVGNNKKAESDDIKGERLSSVCMEPVSLPVMEEAAGRRNR